MFYYDDKSFLIDMHVSALLSWLYGQWVYRGISCMRTMCFTPIVATTGQCAGFPCQNNGICILNSTLSLGFYCWCDAFYVGDRCQTKLGKLWFGCISCDWVFIILSLLNCVNRAHFLRRLSARPSSTCVAIVSLTLLSPWTGSTRN